VTDVSGDLGRVPRLQRREVASVRTADAATVVPDRPLAWDVQVHGGHLFATDHTSGLWVLRLPGRP
jgi:hypothetical protein